MEWKTVKLGDCLSKIIDNRGKTPKDLAASGHPLLEINAVSKNNKYPLYGEAKKYVDDVVYSTWFRSGHPQYGDILVPTVGTLGAVAYVDRNDCCIAQNLIALRANADICDSAYIYYLLCNPQIVKRLLNLDIGAVQASIKVPHLLALEISLPSIETQRRIAAILSSLDDKIENNNRINRNLEAQAQALFKSWFVDFEPWGGTMPEDWKEGVLGDIVTVKRGGSPRPIQDYLSDKGYRWLKISDATAEASPFISHIVEHIKEEGLNKTVFIKQGSLVLSNSATPGLPKFVDLDTCIHDGWLYFPLSYFSNEYLYLLFQRERPYLLSQGNGSVFTNLKTDIVKNLFVIIPTERVLNSFQQIVGKVFTEILNNQRESAHLAALRDTLLPKLMKGEIEL